MCIALVTTAHPDYAIIVLDNRDEFIRRPTTRPHWWASTDNDGHVLSSRDQARAEQGTWLGITKSGKIAVLTNYREEDVQHAESAMSRGAMVTAWLAGDDQETTRQFVDRQLSGHGLRGVGGFSLVCGQLKPCKNSAQTIEPLAILSNRNASPDEVPWIAGERGQVYGLSNTYYSDPNHWPKVDKGKEMVLKCIEEAVEAKTGENELREKLLGILSHDTLPPRAGKDFDSMTLQLKESIFIPGFGEEEIHEALETGNEKSEPKSDVKLLEVELKEAERPSPTPHQYLTGKYGTQRQTILTVDWEGRVVYFERALWDSEGNAIEPGQGDIKTEFQIDNWGV